MYGFYYRISLFGNRSLLLKVSKTLIGQPSSQLSHENSDNIRGHLISIIVFPIIDMPPLHTLIDLQRHLLTQSPFAI